MVNNMTSLSVLLLTSCTNFCLSSISVRLCLRSVSVHAGIQFIDKVMVKGEKMQTPAFYGTKRSLSISFSPVYDFKFNILFLLDTNTKP